MCQKFQVGLFKEKTKTLKFKGITNVNIIQSCLFLSSYFDDSEKYHS